MRRILIIAAIVGLAAGAARAEDAPSSNSPASSEKGLNFPRSQRGPAFPATKSNQQHDQSFGAHAPAPQQRNVPAHKANEINLSNQNLTATFSSGQGWHTLPLGGGGAVVGAIVACDQGPGACAGTGTSTKMVRTDVTGAAYWYNPNTPNCGNARRTGCWQNILTPKNFPGVYVYNSLDASARDFSVSPANTQIVWLYFAQNGCLYKSTTGPGGTYSAAPGWTCKGYVLTNGNTGGQHFILADPNNASVLYVAADANKGAFRTFDAGTTFTNTSSLFPTSGSNNPLSTVYAFDTSNGTGTCPGGGTCTNNVFACVHGTGVWKSVNAGTSFVKLGGSGMPTTCTHMEVDPTGTLWLRDATWFPKLYKWVPSAVGATAGTWTNATIDSDSGLGDFAIDYNHACTLSAQNCRVVAAAFRGGLYETNNSGTSWVYNGNLSAQSTDAPWLALNVVADYINGNAVFFDLAQSNVLWMAGGVGVWTTSPPGNATSAFVYTSITVDIEEIVTARIIAPPGFNPVMGGWDRGVWSLQSQTIYPSYYQSNIGVSGSRAYDVSYSNDFATTGLIVTFNAGRGWYTNDLGDGRASNWTAMTGVPNEVTVSGFAPQGIYSGNNIIALSQNNYIWEIGKWGDLFGTTDNGAHWTKIAPPNNVPVGGAGVTATASGTSNTLKFSAAAGYIDSAFIASVAAGNVTYAVDATKNYCNLGAIASATSSSVTLTQPAACSVKSGDAIYFSVATGWANGGGGTPKNLTVDRASTNVAYVVNASTNAPGIYKIYISGGTYHMVQVLAGNPSRPIYTGGSGTLISVPSTAGDMYWTTASPGSPPNVVTNSPLLECVDSNPSGTSAGTMTCSAVSGVSSVWGIAAGKPKAGGSGYSAIYFYGSIDGTNMGCWQTYDHFATKTQICGKQYEGVAGDPFPGRFDTLTTMAASLDKQGLVYICYNGTACIFGQFN